MFRRFLEKYKLPSFRLKQIYEQYYQGNISSWDELTTWSKDLREKLNKEIPFYKLTNFTDYKSNDKRTIKTLSYTVDGYPVESVMMKNKKRITICISCMSGCPVRCKFCATGQMGKNRNLDVREIVDQVLYFKRKLGDKKITNIVFMGMGEPMLNLDNVLGAIKVFTDKDMLGFGHRRITVSTVGYTEQLEEFLKKNTGVKLAISLHAPTQELRMKLMPTVAKGNKLDKLMKILIKYQKESGKRVTYEYILLKDINDSVEDAKELAKILKNQLALVNIINFNRSDNLPFEPSTRKRIDAFRNILDSRDINNTLRYSYGKDIHAACGQLANRGDSI
jgi:23S rRNA (adenine2503-C2)-methyltransferase